jgi:hypothetical protein
MQRSAAPPGQTTAPPGQTTAPFFSSLFGGGGGTTNNRDNRDKSQPPPSPNSRSRRPTSHGDDHPGGLSPKQQKDKDRALLKDRKPSLGRKPSFIFSAATASPGK